jgi:soluble lytic murein transglycosylase
MRPAQLPSERSPQLCVTAHTLSLGSSDRADFAARVGIGSLTFGKSGAVASAFWRRHCAAWVVLATVLVAPVGAAVASAAATSTGGISVVDREFLAARDAFERRNLNALSQAKSRFERRSDYPLSPYVSYWWFSAQLAGSAQSATELASEIERFVETHDATPFGEALRRDYLRALAKAGRWGQFNAQLGRGPIDDNEVTCQRLRWQLSIDESRANLSQARREAITLWNADKPAAEPCYELFDGLVTAGAISRTQIWHRTRELLAAGTVNDARRTAALLNPAPSGFEAGTASANLDAKRFLGRHVIKRDDRASVELAVFAVSRLARSNADEAAKWLDKNDARLPSEAAAYGWAQVGHWGAMQLQPEALTWFGRAGSLDLNDAQATWLARAALRATAHDPAHWQDVARAINMMSDSERRDPAWRYWLARATLATSQNAEPTTKAAALEKARAEWQRLSRESGFYAVLSADALGVTPQPAFNWVVPDEALMGHIAQRAAIRRALALFSLVDTKPDIRGDAIREWRYGLRGMDDTALLAAAELARRSALPDRAISTAERTQGLHDYTQRFPTPHREQLESKAKQNGLDPAWVFGLIRQESRFMTEARSRVGAQGLMQLMPATAKWAAQQVGLKDYSQSRLGDIGTNLTLGTFYLRHVLDDLGHTVLATAAYNAGPGRARRWRGSVALEGAIYAESIPFTETRDYVKQVFLNKWYYRHRMYGKSPTLTEMLGTVPGKADAAIASMVTSVANIPAASAPAPAAASTPSPLVN